MRLKNLEFHLPLSPQLLSNLLLSKIRTRNSTTRPGICNNCEWCSSQSCKSTCRTTDTAYGCRDAGLGSSLPCPPIQPVWIQSRIWSWSCADWQRYRKAGRRGGRELQIGSCCGSSSLFYLGSGLFDKFVQSFQNAREARPM